MVEITDHGVGIPDIEKAMEPLYTTKPEWERSGMGFAFMEHLWTSWRYIRRWERVPASSSANILGTEHES